MAWVQLKQTRTCQVSQCWANQLKAPRGDTQRVCMEIVRKKGSWEETEETHEERTLPARYGHDVRTRKAWSEECSAQAPAFESGPAAVFSF